MSAPVLIRALGAEEFERIWPIFQEVIAGGDSYPYPADLSLEQARAMWTAAPAQCFVAESAGAVLGCYRLAPNMIGLGDHVANGSYMVASDARGRGIGKLLCAHSLEQARLAGFTAMQFNMVVSSNQAAVQLWQRMGFAIVGRVPGAFRHATLGSTDTYIMHRML